MISYFDAVKIINNSFRHIKPETEFVSLENAVSRRIAEDVKSDVSFPPFSNSAYDGYAVAWEAKVKQWKISGEIQAGGFKNLKSRAGGFKNNYSGTGICASIMTGAKIPYGFDTVIPLEDVKEENGFITLLPGIKVIKGQSIRKKGEDFFKGRLAVKKNTLIKPKDISLIASCGKAKIKVYKKLKIGVLATGDELIDIDKKPTGDKIRASNLYSLLAAIRDANMEAVNFGFIKDGRVILKQKIQSAIKSDIDLLLTTGGVSVGKYDIVKEILELAGMETLFWKVNVKPGKPFLHGIIRRKGVKSRKPILVFGLPGNPVSSFVGFGVFIKPVIRNFFGVESHTQFPITAKLLSPLKKTDCKRHFIRGSIFFDPNKNNLFVDITGSQSSGNYVGLGQSNCLIIFEENKRLMRRGELVRCIKI